MYVFLYVCTYVQFAQIKLVQLTTLYDYELRAVCKNHRAFACTEHENVRQLYSSAGAQSCAGN